MPAPFSGLPRVERRNVQNERHVSVSENCRAGDSLDLRKEFSPRLDDDFLLADDEKRRRWEAATTAVDELNTKYGGTVVSLGPWNPPAGGHVGGKISYTRIPSAEDFW